MNDKVLEMYWEVTKNGVKPIMCNPEDLKKSDSWLSFHVYEGKTIFENYSRAMLCWYEKNEAKANIYID